MKQSEIDEAIAALEKLEAHAWNDKATRNSYRYAHLVLALRALNPDPEPAKPTLAEMESELASLRAVVEAAQGACNSWSRTWQHRDHPPECREVNAHFGIVEAALAALAQARRPTT